MVEGIAGIMFQELDGVMENLPTLIDEDLLFEGEAFMYMIRSREAVPAVSDFVKTDHEYSLF